MSSADILVFASVLSVALRLSAMISGAVMTRNEGYNDGGREKSALFTQVDAFSARARNSIHQLLIISPLQTRMQGRVIIVEYEAANRSND